MFTSASILTQTGLLKARHAAAALSRVNLAFTCSKLFSHVANFRETGKPRMKHRGQLESRTDVSFRCLPVGLSDGSKNRNTNGGTNKQHRHQDTNNGWKSVLHSRGSLHFQIGTRLLTTRNAEIYACFRCGNTAA